MPIVPYTPSLTATVMSYSLNDKENILSPAKKTCETSPSKTKGLQTSGFITKPLLEKHQLNTLTLSENGNSCKLAPENDSSIIKRKRKEPMNSESGCSRTDVLPMKKLKT
ncbi:hypothetical protein FOCC_FOCC012736 [Frankliniella occidentalis]|uniref:Uncharacterized protein LOC113209206 n=1 Tax=Frankliniella occidentalis TaxID=133901 RepID=A0A9C6X2X4_FRAOC|nr:uncharacterized protein LOC113209206 [Frankliniella occidentalis]KAE8741741.1 hypothetical protein FOCC_FOCC012736 [Frankliniella occidentalis]